MPAITVATAAPAYAGTPLAPPNVVTTMTAIVNGGRVTHDLTFVNTGAAPTSSLVVNLVLTMTATTALTVGHAYDEVVEIDGNNTLWSLDSRSLTLGSGPRATPADPDTLELSFQRIGPQLAGNNDQFTLHFVSIQPAAPIGFTDAAVAVSPGSAQPVPTAPWA